MYACMHVFMYVYLYLCVSICVSIRVRKNMYMYMQVVQARPLCCVIAQSTSLSFSQKESSLLLWKGLCDLCHSYQSEAYRPLGESLWSFFLDKRLCQLFS